MGDLALTYKNGIIDLDLGEGGTAIDEGLRTAVIISLFTDRRASASDAIPDGTDDRRGWWGDIYPDVEGDLIGCRLWLLDREKDLPSRLRLAETYAREGLAWMIEDSVAKTVEVSASSVRQGVLALSIKLQSEDGREYAYAVYNGPPGAVVYVDDSQVILDENGFAITDRTGGGVSGR